MIVDAIIKTALNSIAPVEANVYRGTAADYIVWNYADERPAMYADDTDTLDETTVQVHYFTRGDPGTNKKAIRRALRSAGFTIQSTTELYESDTDYTHVVVYAYIEGAVED